MNRHDILIELAALFVGITEQGGDNKGAMIEQFQKAVDGKAEGEAWCLGMAYYLCNQTDLEYDKLHNRTHVDRHDLYPTEHVQTLWYKTPKSRKYKEAQPGYLACWAFYKNGKKTTSGHVGVVTKVFDGGIITIEGNTGPDDKTIVREGDGVYKKVRKLTGYKTMKLLGFIDPWE